MKRKRVGPTFKSLIMHVPHYSMSGLQDIRSSLTLVAKGGVSKVCHLHEHKDASTIDLIDCVVIFP